MLNVLRGEEGLRPTPTGGRAAVDFALSDEPRSRAFVVGSASPKMCGIVAFLSLDGAVVSRDDVRVSASMIAHRGPDDARLAVLDEGRVALAHVRLAVVDLATGQQPMYDAERTACIVFNGEVYDHAAWRERLGRDGERFATTSDTEVILALYRRYGLEAFDRLEGEFAFVLWDLPRRRIVAARDRFGLKPLFVRQTAA